MIEIIDHSVEIISMWNDPDGNPCPYPVYDVTEAARTCYQSAQKKTYVEREAMIHMLIGRGHTAMLEFADVTFRIITDRGVTHELVRHRIASYAQESTRYCNYGGKSIQFVKPVTLMQTTDGSIEGPWTDEYSIWLSAMYQAAENYNNMLKAGCSPQIARSVLPNSLKTEICAKFNMRSFRNFVQLRTDKAAHPDMQYVAGKCVELIMDTEYRIFIEDLIGGRNENS